MAHLIALVSAAWLGAAQAAPAVPQSFEQSLGLIHGEILAARREQVKSDVRGDIALAHWDTRSLWSLAGQLRSKVAGIARRARGARPPFPNDPFLRSDVYRVVTDVRTYARRVSLLESNVADIAARAQKDPEAVTAAQELLYDSQRLGGDAHWLAVSAGWARNDLRAAGFMHEAVEMDRAAEEGERDARDIEILAQDILAKVGGMQ